eukprot:5487902-Pleurochrysis_carterae.AAC.1
MFAMGRELPPEDEGKCARARILPRTPPQARLLPLSLQPNRGRRESESKRLPGPGSRPVA